jgi:adenosylmethionine-8-amino-7-oxononanoate aminotransferase
MHFSPPAGREDVPPPVFVRGEGAWVEDALGNRYFDALSSLYCVNVGHGRQEIAEAMASQAEELAYFSIWGQLTPPVVECASRVVELTPDGIERVFFTSGGSESVDSAWKLVRQYHRLRGREGKLKVIARQGAYHGTSLGALSITGIPSLREPFQPLVPGVIHGPKVDPYHADGSPLEHSLECADAIAKIIETEGPETVGAVFVEPVQNAGGCLVAEPEYFAALRETCDAYDVLLVSDETICSWGRLGDYFGCQTLGYQPDIITTAKGLTSAYAPLGAVLMTDSVAETFIEAGNRFDHGLTFGGHPVATAAAVANLDIIAREGLCDQGRVLGQSFREGLEGLRELPIVGDVRGIGLFQAVELVADAVSKAPLDEDQRARMQAFVPKALFDAGVICRAFHRGSPVLQFAPPLVSTEEELMELVGTVRSVLVETLDLLEVATSRSDGSGA